MSASALTGIVPSVNNASTPAVDQVCQHLSNLSLKTENTYMVICDKCSPPFSFVVDKTKFTAAQVKGQTITKVTCACKNHHHELIFGGDLRANIVQRRIIPMNNQTESRFD